MAVKDLLIVFTMLMERPNFVRTRHDVDTTGNSLKQPPVHLDKKRRAAIKSAITGTCEIRGWYLWAFNIRTNHVHTVVTARCDPERVLTALKANATRQMKETRCWNGERSPWSRRGSKRRLWTEEDLSAAIVYVLYDQGLPLPE